MEMRQKKLAILNLTGELIPELAEYLSSRNATVVNPLENSESHDWTHIITKDIHDFTLLNKTYEITKKQRNIISLSQVNDLQNFTLNNGNLIFSDIWFKGPMGNFIMDKYFQAFGGINLGDNYPAFNEIGSFNVANPFNTGEYLDRLVHKAFENGASALTVKTFFDHLVMYVTGLKNKGKAGLPFEVTYGVFEDIFAVQLHFFSKELTVMDVSTSLSSQISKKAEEYYLNVAVQSADFFDLSFMPQVNKVMVTALWTKDERIKFENRGLMLSSLIGGLPLALYKNEGSTSTIVGGDPIEDFSEKVTIPDSLTDDNSVALVKGFTEDGQKPVLVKGSTDEDEGSQTINGTTEDDSFAALLKGIPETEDEKQIIKGGSLLEEVAQTVKGKFEEDKHVVKISGDKIDVDKVAFSIAAKVDETTKEKDLKVRSLGGVLPQSIKTGLFDFAKGLGKEVDSLNDNDLDRFQVQKVPEIIKRELMALAGRSIEQSGSDPNSKLIEQKLAAANVENEKLKSQLKTMAAEVRILKEARNKMAELQMKAKQEPSEITIKADDDEQLRKEFQQKLNSQKALNEMELKKLSSLLDRESKLIAELKQEEMNGRKIQFEASKKEIYFSQEIEKAQRAVKGKDLIILKTKETFTKLVEKKEREVQDLKAKMDQLTKLAAGSAQNNQAIAVRELEKQNQNLLKQIEGYKNKITTLSTNMQPSKSEDSLKEEVRKLQMLNQQTKNQLDLQKKDYEKQLTKASLEVSQMGQLRLEKLKLEEQVKKLQSETKATAAQPLNISQNEGELKRLQAQNQILDQQVKDTTAKMGILELKLTEALKPQKPVGTQDDNSKVKVTQLENSVKKLTQDLLAAKNQVAEEKKETNKLRQEKTALQNQLDKLKKEADKAKPALPKKPGGKAA